MLASPSPVLPRGPEWAYELKWDGVRAQFHASVDGWQLFTRRGRDVAAILPELAHLRELVGDGSVVDGELIVQRADGAADFGAVMGRLTSRARAAEHPVTFVAFDLLVDGERSLHLEPYAERRARLASRPRLGVHWYAPEAFGGPGDQLEKLVRQRGLEGLVAKHVGGLYRPGTRSSAWLKVLNPQHPAFGRVGRAKAR
jgi:bifunctional non-homologous end joining protein LigD